MDAKKLIDSWGIPDSPSERTQLTLRISQFDSCRLKALKAVYPKRTVNDLVVDIITAGLDEITEALPTYSYNGDDADCGNCDPWELGKPYGPKMVFDEKLKILLSNLHFSKNEADEEEA